MKLILGEHKMFNVLLCPEIFTIVFVFDRNDKAIRLARPSSCMSQITRFHLIKLVYN